MSIGVDFFAGMGYGGWVAQITPNTIFSKIHLRGGSTLTGRFKLVRTPHFGRSLIGFTSLSWLYWPGGPYYLFPWTDIWKAEV